MPIPTSPQVIDYIALLPDVPTWKPVGRRKGPARPLWDLWKVTCTIWEGSPSIAWKYPPTHRTNR